MRSSLLQHCRKLALVCQKRVQQKFPIRSYPMKGHDATAQIIQLLVVHFILRGGNHLALR